MASNPTIHLYINLT